MTDTASPITEPHLTPMFATGAQPALSPNTEPHPSPIFDTGPHPEPLRSAESDAAATPSDADDAPPEPVDPDPLEWDSDEWEAAAWASRPNTHAAPVLEYERAPVWDAGVESEPELAKIARGIDAASDVPMDLASDAPIEVACDAPVEVASDAPIEVACDAASDAPIDVASDALSDVLADAASDADAAADALAEAEPPVSHAPPPRAFSELENVDTDAFLRSVTGHLAPVVVPAQPVVVPGNYQFVKRWKFALIVAGVWLLAAAAGAGCYYWWYTALDKTLPVFGILLYLTVCMVASVLVSLVPNRPTVTALAIALMSAPLASTAAAAVLHGAYFFEWIARPTIG